MDAEVFAQTYLENLGKEVHLIDGVSEMISSLTDSKLAILTNGFKDVQLARIGGSMLKIRSQLLLHPKRQVTKSPSRDIRLYLRKVTNNGQVPSPNDRGFAHI